MLSDTRVSIRLTPGCHATQHPGVRYAETRVSDKLYFHGKKSNGCNRRIFYRLYLFSFSGVQITFLIRPLNPNNLSPICFNGKISVS